jgi:hypothetical protein
MANYDAGHYFLTALAPVRMDSVLRDGQSHSRRHLIREALANMPTDENTIVSRDRGTSAPFARNQATHFARFAVIDDVPYNGKVTRDPLLTALLGILPARWQPRPAGVDQLATPYLLFAADFDAASGGEAELTRYLTTLWEEMGEELREVLQHCTGFETVSDAAQFCAYVRRCQVETTMPFNDYWVPAPSLQNVSLNAFIYPGAILGILFVISLLWFILRPGYRPEFTVLLLLLALAGVAWLAIRRITAAANIPFPPSATMRATLPEVLKSLYLQRAFTGFAIATQGQDDAALHSAFGEFLATHRPEEPMPTQEPGVIGQ